MKSLQREHTGFRPYRGIEVLVNMSLLAEEHATRFGIEPIAVGQAGIKINGEVESHTRENVHNINGDWETTQYMWKVWAVFI